MKDQIFHLEGKILHGSGSSKYVKLISENTFIGSDMRAWYFPGLWITQIAQFFYSTDTSIINTLEVLCLVFFYILVLLLVVTLRDSISDWYQVLDGGPWSSHLVWQHLHFYTSKLAYKPIFKEYCQVVPTYLAFVRKPRTRQAQAPANLKTQAWDIRRRVFSHDPSLYG